MKQGDILFATYGYDLSTYVKFYVVDRCSEVTATVKQVKNENTYEDANFNCGKGFSVPLIDGSGNCVREPVNAIRRKIHRLDSGEEFINIFKLPEDQCIGYLTAAKWDGKPKEIDHC